MIKFPRTGVSLFQSVTREFASLEDGESGRTLGCTADVVG